MREPAPPRALFGLQIAAGAVIASFVVGAVHSSTVLGQASGSFDGFPLTSFQLGYALLSILVAVGLWLAAELPGMRVVLRAAAVLTAVSPFVSLGLFAVELTGGFEEPESYKSVQRYARWAYMVSALLPPVAIAAALARRRDALGAWFPVAVVAIAAFLAHTTARSLSAGYAVWFFGGKGQLLLTAASLIYTVGVAGGLSALRRTFDDSLAGSWRDAADGLYRYRQAIIWRLVLAISMVSLGFMAAMGRSMGLAQLIMVASTALSVLIALHALRGLVGFSRQPMTTGGGVAATTAASLFAVVTVFAGEAMVRLPRAMGWIEPDHGNYSSLGRRDALELIQSAGAMSNLIGFASLLAVIYAVIRVARTLERDDLLGSARILSGLIVLAGAAVAYLQIWAGAGRAMRGMRASEALFIAVAILILAIVALGWYLKLLRQSIEAIEIASGDIVGAEPQAPPRAIAREL